MNTQIFYIFANSLLFIWNWKTILSSVTISLLWETLEKPEVCTNLSGDSCLSASRLLTSSERLRRLWGENLVLDGEWLCFDILSEALAEG